MTQTVISENLKKFRLSKNFTQEHVGEVLNVNAQTVSRWECGTTLPDVLILPKIARLYDVTVDDLYKKGSVVYENYAQRLSAVYEQTRDPEDFLRCVLEYKKLINQNQMSISDKWNYATIHHFMMRYCKDMALEWYDKTLADDPESNPDVYRRAGDLKDWLMFEIGNADKIIMERSENIKNNPNDPREWDTLIAAYIYAKQYEKAYECFRKAAERFPDQWTLYIHGGDICQKLKKYDEAFSYWDKAGEIGTYFYDELYCKADCYDDMGEYEKSYQLYEEISQILRNDGYDVEADMAHEYAIEVKAKISD